MALTLENSSIPEFNHRNPPTIDQELHITPNDIDVSERDVDSFNHNKLHKSNISAQSYTSELRAWVENNLDMQLCPESKEHVNAFFSKEIVLYDQVKDQIWDGSLPLRIAREISLLCKGNQVFSKILYSRWFERQNFPFQSHNREHLWTSFKISIPSKPPANKQAFKDACLECWKGCVAFIKTGTVSKQYVILKTLEKGDVSYETCSYKDFIATLSSLVPKEFEIDLPELFQRNSNLFTYTTIDRNKFSFSELSKKWHPDCLYIHVGSFLERAITQVPSEYQAQRFAGHLKSINDLIRSYCDHEEALAVHFKKIIAWKLQHLSERTGVAIVIASPQNCLKSGFIRWISNGTFGPDALKSIKGGLWGLLKDNYSGALLEGFSILQADEIGSKPLSVEDLEAFKNICDDQNTTQHARAIKSNWGKQTQNLEIWVSSNSTEPSKFPFANMYSPVEYNRRVLPLVSPNPIPKALFEACLSIFKESNPILMRLFIEDCNNLLSADPDFLPNKGIPLTPFIEKLRSISALSLLIDYFQNLPQDIKDSGKVAVKAVAEELSLKIEGKVDARVVTKLFREMNHDMLPLQSLEIKSGQNIPATGDTKRQTNVSAFVWNAP